ncbi:hypothetical protein [Burkholderia gladioli]|uniref:hypothetical protein n=1 Tax=Burkholderia gladioli TaxID=28095 RepID=UPI00163E51EE|nr:hypothetical protein [Burkholderia gladioli]
MIPFTPLRSRRLDLTFRELSFDDEMALCFHPEAAHESSLTDFLARAIKHANPATDTHVTDPRAMTVSERLLALAHYNLHIRDDAPNYAVTEAASLFDFLDASRENVRVPTFVAAGESWTITPLIGAAAEAIEVLQNEVQGERAGFRHWMLGMMAAQLLRAGEMPGQPGSAAAPDPVTASSEYIDWLRSRMAVLNNLPSSALNEMFAHFRTLAPESSDFFRIWFDDKGVIVLPKEAGAAFAPARFLILSAVSQLAIELAGKA